MHTSDVLGEPVGAHSSTDFWRLSWPTILRARKSLNNAADLGVWAADASMPG
jgi:hypothetical protein